MDLSAAASVWADGEFDWAWLSRRIALPPLFPLPMPAGRVLARLAANVASDGSATLEIDLTYRLFAPMRWFDGAVELGPQIRLVLGVQLASAAALAAAHADWYANAPASRLSGTLRCELALRLAPLPTIGPMALHSGDASGWIAVRARFEAGDSGASLTLEVDDIGEATLQLPALPLAEPPLRFALRRVRGRLQASGDRWQGELAIEGRFRFAPRIEPGNVALLGYLAPLFEGVDLEGEVACTLTLAERPSLMLRGRFDNAEVGVDLLALLRELSRGLSATQPMAALDTDLRSRSRVGFRFAGIAVRIDEDPRFAIELSALMAGLTLPAHLELSRRELHIGLGESSLAAQPQPLELPLRVPHVTAADLGYAGGVAAARNRAGSKPPDQWIHDKVSSDKRGEYDQKVQQLVDAVEALTGAASGGTGVVVARREAARWDIALRDPALAPSDDVPLYVGSGSVQAQGADGAWAATGDAALVCRVDGAWSVLLAAPRLRFVGFHLAVDLNNPRNIRIGGTIAFVFVDGGAQEQIIEAQAELSADAIYFSVRQVDSPPIRAGGIEIRIARLLFGFGYTKRSLAMAFAGELALPESLVDALDTSDLVGAGIRIPQQTKLDFKFEVMPLVFGQVVIPMPFFQFDWDARKKTSLAIQDTRLCEPFWDGAQLIVTDVLRVSLKHLSFSPILAFFACANSDFDADFALGSADNGLTVVADNIFWAYGQDSWTANLLTPINIVPFCDNFCIGLRGAGFRLSFNLQRPIPAFSPMAVFELIALAVDIEHYQVAPRGALADSVRISITDTCLVLPPRVRRLFPGTDGVLAKPFEHTVNLADYIELLQGCIAMLRRMMRAALSARDDWAHLAQRLQAESARLRGGGITQLLGDMLAALPGELRATRVDASFAGFDGSAVIVLADPARAAVELDARGVAGSPFSAAEFAEFGSADLAALPAPASNQLAVIVGARLGVADSQQLDWLGSMVSDGSFNFVSSARASVLQLRVAGISAALPLQVQGRLQLRGRAGPSGVEGQVTAAVRAEWAALGADARLSVGTPATPATLALRGDGRFRIQGAGLLALRGDTMRIDGTADVSDSHAMLSGALRHQVAELVDIELEMAGAIGPGARVELTGTGTAKLLGMPLADVEGHIDLKRLALSARLRLDQWRPSGRNAVPIELDLRLAGGIELGEPQPNLRLAGSGRLSIFGAEIADGRAGVELRSVEAKAGRKPAHDVVAWVEGTLRWHDRDWLGARVELEARRVKISGRSTLSFDVTPPGMPAGLLLAIGFEASIALHLPEGTLETLSLQGEWWVGVRQGKGGAHVVPIAVGSLPRLSEKDLPRVLISIPGFALPKLDATLDLPLPVIDGLDPASFSIPSSVTLPELDKAGDRKAASLFDPDNIANALGIHSFSFLTNVSYKNLTATPSITLGGLSTPFSIPTRFTPRWPDTASLPLPFEPVPGFTLALDWDAADKRFVLTGEARGPAPKLDVMYDPKGVDLDAEYVDIVNDSAMALDLTGWSVHDAADRERRFVFPKITLEPGATLRLWSGSGVDDAGNLHWGRRQAVWNNTGDTAILRDARGIEQRRVSFGPPKKQPP